MAELKYGLRPTLAGRGYIANCIAQGGTVDITHMAVGDGNGSAITPSPEMTALVKERHRAPISSIAEGGTTGQLIFTMVLPVAVGGFVVRELGIFADDVLVAVAATPEMPKPLLEDGAGTSEEMRAHLFLAEAEAGTFQLKVDNTIVHVTHKELQAEMEAHNADDTAHPEKANVDHDHLTEDVTDLLSDPHSWTKGQRYAQTSLPIEAGAVVWNMEANPHAVLKLTANVTSFTVSNFKAGATYELTVLQDATGSRTMNWPASIRWPGGSAAEVTTDANAEDLINFSVRDDGGTPILRGYAGQDFKVVS